MMLECRKIRIIRIATLLLVLLEVVHVTEQTCTVTETNITATQTALSTLTSPGYNGGSGTYISNMDCWWIIDAGADDLKLVLYLLYDLACSGDLINIYDGSEDTATKLVSNTCGTVTEPGHYSTSQRYARIEMVSDGTTEKAGFKLEYVAGKDYSGTGCTSAQTLTTTTEYQFLSSQNFPGEYSSNNDCRWNLYYPYGAVEIDVIVQDMEDDDTPSVCDFDKYQVFDGENKCDNNVAFEVCSDFPRTSPYSYTSNGTHIVVTLSSDNSVQRRGFYLRYRGISSTTTTSYSTTTSTTSVSSESQIDVPLLLGIIFGSIILLCFIIMTVVFVVKRVQIPLEKTVTSQVQPIKQQRPSIDSSATVRSRKPSKSKVLSPNTLNAASRLSETRPPPYSVRSKPRVINGAPPRGGSNHITDTSVIITDF